MSEPRRTTARRGTKRTRKLAEPVAAPVSGPARSPEPTPPEQAPAPEPTPASAPTPPLAPPAAPAPAAGREWVPIVYEGEGVFADAQAGVFVAGTRTRLRERIASRLLRVEGFRLAG
ncbi:MAG: hypothetical protein M9894_37475 [Planctomycetes bacterium]|nr:hypothetical protein [Planctomycetota bacterium]